jgi:hypothetical protein
MVGSDKDKFKDLASETKLPEARQDSCAGDYSNASYSWDLVLRTHLRSPDQPKAKVDVVYGEAWGRLELGRPNGSLPHVVRNGGPARGRRIRLARPVFVGNANLWLFLMPVGTFRHAHLHCVMS